MKRFLLSIIYLYLAGMLVAQTAPLEILPYPNEVKVHPGHYPFMSCQLVYPNALKNEADYLKQLLLEEHGLIVQHTKQGNMQLTLSKWIPHPEGYRLTVNEQGIRIEGSTPQGVFYGLQTFRQLITTHQGQIRIPYVVIDDAPAFKWRSFMLDDGRAFKGMKEVKQLLDEMAILKMNTFHWHLTEDQGWRIEIKKYPLLTEIGAHRDSTQLNWYESKVFDGKPFDGYYTQREIKEIVSYARNLHITVVPEIEMPGHASAAIASYPWLGTTGKQIKVPCNFGVHYNAYNVADPRVIQFQEDVLEEVIALFPSPVIHIGGDELRYNAWKESPMVRNYMKQNKITSPGGLQVFFTNNISNFLASKNRHMMGWNEITGAQVNDYQRDGSGASQQQLAPGTIVHFWKGEPELIKETIEKGYDIVNSYHIYTYLDYDYESIPLQKSYEFNPIPEGLTEAQQSKVFGIGCQMWGEFIPTVESMNKKIYPRLAAYAEVGWTNPSNKDFDRFRNSLNSFIGHWEKLGIQLGEWK